jgi:biopolymer transport protein ExbB
MEDAAQQENARLHRKIEYLSLLSSVAPMLGLLGTVWGMVIAFQRVAETHGRADPGQLAGGIYQALYTTVIGLIIAIPGLACYGFLRNRIDDLSAECALLAERVLAPLKQIPVSTPTGNGTTPVSHRARENPFSRREA